MESLFPHLFPRWVLTRTTKAFPILSQTLHCFLARFFTLSLRPNRERLLQTAVTAGVIVPRYQSSSSQNHARRHHRSFLDHAYRRVSAVNEEVSTCQTENLWRKNRGKPRRRRPGTSAESCDRKYRSDVKTGSTGHCNCSFGGKKRPIADEWLDRSCGPALPNPRQLSSVFHFHM